jgi:hypothetical protein
VVQGLIRIGRPRIGFKHGGQDISELSSRVWIAGHRLQIRIGILNAMESVGL